MQYYYEPGTGKKFRSTKEVERYLTGEEYTRSRSWSRSRSDKPFTLGHMRVCLRVAYFPVDISRCHFSVISHDILCSYLVQSSGSRKMIVSGGMVSSDTSFFPKDWLQMESLLRLQARGD